MSSKVSCPEKSFSSAWSVENRTMTLNRLAVGPSISSSRIWLIRLANLDEDGNVNSRK